MGNINLTKRLDSVLEKLPEFQHTAGRLAVISLPFIALYRPAQTPVAVLSCSLQIINLYNQQIDKEAKCIQVAKNIAFVVLAYFRPQEAALIGLAVQTYEDIQQKNAYAIFSRIIYFISLVNRDPRWALGALCLEVIKDGQEAVEEFNKDHYLETGGKVLMACLRAYQAKEECSRIQRRYFGKEVTQEVLDKALEEGNVGKALKKGGGSDVVKDVEVRLTKEKLKKVKLKDMVFERVDFSKSNLWEMTIENVTFKDCKMENIYLYKVDMVRVSWENCNVSKGTFYHCRGSDVTFKGCDLTHFCLSECDLTLLQIVASKLYASSFFGNRLQASVIKDSDLTDVLLTNASFNLIDCTENKITKPVIALTWDFYQRGSWAKSIPGVLEDQKVLTLKFPTYLEDIDSVALHKEVAPRLLAYPLEGKSRAQRLLDDPQQPPELEKIIKRANEVMKYANGAILSGGENVEEVFYQQKDSINKNFWYDDYRRSLLEFAVAHAGKPVMGICRGSQLLNVYLGGTLKNVPYQEGRQVFSYAPGPQGEAFRKKMGEIVLGSNAHYQGVDRLGQGLHVILEKDGIIKATISAGRFN